MIHTGDGNYNYRSNIFSFAMFLKVLDFISFQGV